MSAYTFARRFVTLFVVLGMLLGQSPPVAVAQDGGTLFLPVTLGTSAPTEEVLFRTFVTVQTAVQWRDLERMQPVFLDRGDDWATTGRCSWSTTCSWPTWPGCATTPT